MKRAALVIIALLFCYSCSGSDGKTITVGTFNVEWLGDGNDDKFIRSEDDYRNIAELIDKLGVDVLALQEIENRQALDRIMKYLPDFSSAVSEPYGDQSLACIYKKGMGLSVEYVGDYAPLSVSGKMRGGMVMKVTKGKTSFLMMIVHFKATSSKIYTAEENREALAIRYRQAMLASLWADSVMKNGREKELMIAGDFNDYKKPVTDSSNTLLPLCVNKKLVMLTQGLQSCRYKNRKTIDHIFVSKKLKERVLPHSLRTYDFNLTIGENEARKISDHCPVLVELKTD